MALRVDAIEFQEKQARRLKGALEDMRTGVGKVTEAPTKLAAAKIDKMKANLDEAFASGKVKRSLEKVTLEDWKTKMLNVGIARVSGGIDASKDKVIAFATALLPAVESARNKVKAMPDLTLDDNIARMTTYIREMGKFKYK